MLVRVASSAGVRKRQPGNPCKWEVPMLNGFRRFHNKEAKNTEAGESTLAVHIKSEYMMGHSGLTSLDRHYYKADIEEKAKTYVKMVPSLTISESERLKHSRADTAEIAGAPVRGGGGGGFFCPGIYVPGRPGLVFSN